MRGGGGGSEGDGGIQVDMAGVLVENTKRKKNTKLSPARADLCVHDGTINYA